jgi:hypothetical protein
MKSPLLPPLVAKELYPLLYIYFHARCPLQSPLFFIHHPCLFQSTKKMSDNPIKFSSSESSSEDDLLAHQSSEVEISSDV